MEEEWGPLLHSDSGCFRFHDCVWRCSGVQKYIPNSHAGYQPGCLASLERNIQMFVFIYSHEINVLRHINCKNTYIIFIPQNGGHRERVSH